MLFSISGILILSNQNTDLKHLHQEKQARIPWLLWNKCPLLGSLMSVTWAFSHFFPFSVSIHILISCKCTARAPCPLPTGAQRAPCNPSLPLSSRRGCQLACRAAAWGCSGMAWPACRVFFQPAGQHIIWICSSEKTKNSQVHFCSPAEGDARCRCCNNSHKLKRNCATVGFFQWLYTVSRVVMV